MRADRLLSILLHLQANGRMTAATLARRLEVSARTIHRDMEALSAAGVPVYGQRGIGGGWTLDEDYRTNLTALNESETQALFLAAPERLLADLGLRGAAEAALVKLLAALPENRRRDADSTRRRIHVDPPGWHHDEDELPALAILQEAVWRDSKLRLSYARADGTAVERDVDPLGLVAKGRLWYLVAAVDGQPRTYRVSRVREAVLLGEPAVRPRDFDLAAYWAQSSAGFVAALPRFRMTVRAAPEVVERLTAIGWYVRIERRGEPETDGWTAFDLVLHSEEEAVRYALGFGAQMEVLEPRALRGEVLRRAQKTAALYGV